MNTLTQNQEWVFTASPRINRVTVFRWDSANLALHEVSYTDTEGAAFLVYQPERNLLFVVHELNKFGGQPGGGVSSFSFDPSTGALELRSTQTGCGVYPCHVSLDRTGQWLLTSNYGDGTHSVFPVDRNGNIGACVNSISNTGDFGPGQSSGHAHSSLFSADNRFVSVCDLGLDRVIIYAFDSEQGKLTEISGFVMAPGAGPRHQVQHPHLPILYVINELNSTVTVLEWDTHTGALTHRQTLSTLPDHFDKKNSGADIHLSQDSQTLYLSNRGHDTVAAFAVSPETGLLDPPTHCPTGGHWPRNFCVHQSGMLLIANQYSSTITTSSMNHSSLSPPAITIAAINQPTCVVV